MANLSILNIEDNGVENVMNCADELIVKITQHKWAWPFMQLVDVEGPGLPDAIYEAEMNLEELKEPVMQNCRKMTIQEKRNFGAALDRLFRGDLAKALEILAPDNPGIQATFLQTNLE